MMSFSDDLQPPPDGTGPRLVAPAAGESNAAASAPLAPSGDEREQHLSPQFIAARRLSGGIGAAILAFLALIAVIVTSFKSPDLRLLLPLGWLVASGGLAAFKIWWPVVVYRHTAYRVDPLGLWIRQGVIWRSLISVPKTRVQHTDVSQGPIERLFGLATLVVYTAGTHHASVPLAGLDHETALAIRDHLIVGGEGQGDAV